MKNLFQATEGQDQTENQVLSKVARDLQAMMTVTLAEAIELTSTSGLEATLPVGSP